MATRMPPPPPPSMAPMPSSFDEDHDFRNERPMQKVFRKLKEEPLIPLGAGLTVIAFVNAWRALRRGDSVQANRMFRARIAAQSFTIIAMVAGSMYYSRDRQKTKELRRLEELREAEEKRLRWIRELEARDEENKAFHARMQNRARGRSADQAPAEGGVLGKMGLWKSAEEKSDRSQGEPVFDNTAAATDDPVDDDKQSRRRNPKSSMDAISGVILSQKKEGNKSSTPENKSEK